MTYLTGAYENVSSDVIKHFGVKGMHWGVRKKDVSSSGLSSKQKKAIAITGSVIGAAAIAGGVYFAQKHMGVRVSDIGSLASKGKDFTSAIAKEPVGIVHATRGKNVGWTFPARGGLTDPLSEYMKAGFETVGGGGQGAGYLKRYGTRSEKIAASFLDPEGRLDHAGRRITHDVMLPEELARGITTLDQVKAVAWPLIKDTYGALYEATKS